MKYPFLLWVLLNECVRLIYSFSDVIVGSEERRNMTTAEAIRMQIENIPIGEPLPRQDSISSGGGRL